MTPEKYDALYKQSIEDPHTFWGDVASKELEWFSPWKSVFEWDNKNYTWFTGATLNISYNCLDRHAQGQNKNKIAYIAIDENEQSASITYAELLERVNQCANGLKELGITKGDRVILYMPLVIEHIVAMLACARIGAIHSVVFAGLSEKALRDRIIDSEAKLVITANWTMRRGKKVSLKKVVDSAVQDIDSVRAVLVLVRGEDTCELNEKDVDYHTLIDTQSKGCEPEPIDSEDPLFILYTSGSTGKPKGIVHTTGGYSVYTHYTTKTVFDIQENDVFWCTADPGWITGHSYVVYGPLSVGATSVIAEGAPDYPTPDKWWSIIEKHKVSIFYTSPTAIRMLRKYGEKYITPHDISSLRILGTVGEPISPEAWNWYYEHVGKNNCVVLDTWWQTETGGHMIVSLPSLLQKPGKAGKPFFGIDVDIVNTDGESVTDGEKGLLVIRKPWPSALRTCWGDPERFAHYWNEIEGVYTAGDVAIRDTDGYIQILGRSDDVINVSGHRIGTAEAESAIATHPSVAEVAVIGKDHEIKGQCIKAFVVLKTGENQSTELTDGIQQQVRKELGGYAVPDEIEYVSTLPKTRSGKIMRRILRAQEAGDDIGDVSTLED